MPRKSSSPEQTAPDAARVVKRPSNEQRRAVQLSAKRRLTKARAELASLTETIRQAKDRAKDLQRQIASDEALIVAAVNEPIQLDLFAT